MTNRERARAWLLDTYPSAWEAEHVQSLTTMLNGAMKLDRALVVSELRRLGLEIAAHHVEMLGGI